MKTLSEIIKKIDAIQRQEGTASETLEILKNTTREQREKEIKDIKEFIQEVENTEAFKRWEKANGYIEYITANDPMLYDVLDELEEKWYIKKNKWKELNARIIAGMLQKRFAKEEIEDSIKEKLKGFFRSQKSK